MGDFFLEFPDDESQTKEIYARFGLAAYTASVFEEAIAIETTMLVLVAELRTGKIKTEAEWHTRHDEEMAVGHSLTLGRGLSRLSKLLQPPVELRELFDRALQSRNYLLHHFFRDEIQDFYTAAGRLRMFDKLVSYVDLFSRADRELMAATSESRHRLGLTEEKLKRSLEELETEYRAR